MVLTRSLAGKFFTNFPLPLNKKTETSLQQQWSYFLSGDFKMTIYNGELFVFAFNEEEDFKNVIEKGPWNVDGKILVLKEYLLETSLTDIDFSEACFWVKAEGLPLSNYTREEAKKIAKKLSDKPLIHNYIDRSKRAFWVKVEVDLTQPLKAGFFIEGKRKPHYVQFKYKNLEKFCKVCGKIDHTYCKETPKERPLTRKFRTKTYGHWLRDGYGCVVRNSSSAAKFEFNFSEKKQISETEEEEEKDVETELLVDFKIDVVYKSEHVWLGKTLRRSVPDKNDSHCFRLPLSLLISKAISNDTRVYETLSSEIEEIAPLVGLKSWERACVIGMFTDYLLKMKNKWLCCKNRYVPIKAHVIKQIMIPIVECETMLQERRDDELHVKINLKISELIKTRVERNENLVSLSEWMESIEEALREIGVTLVELELKQKAVGARKEAIEMELTWRKGSKPADRQLIEELETVEVLRHDMCLCTICKEEMFLGEEATRMPCSHLFHGKCLQAWLKTRNSCPLCRFKLPT